jgi:hypothetical protein
MTAIPAQRDHRVDPVSVTDDAVEISRIRVTHPETIAIARRELAEHGPAALADTVATAVVVGMVATGLQRSSGDTSAAMERVLAGFDEAMQVRAASTLAQLDGLLGRIDTTEQATREAATAALAGLPLQIERGLTTALAGGANDVQEAVRKAAATAQAEALTALERVVALHSEQVRAAVSTENPRSPIAALRRDLTATMEGTRRELAEGLATVRALVQAQQAGHAAAQKNSNTVGKDWEDAVAEAVAGWSQASGDVVEHVGTRPAPGSSSRKTGDVLIRVMTGTRPVMIVEAKRRQKPLTMRQYRDELAEARRIRRAHAALAVVPTQEGVPGPGRWARVDANSWVVAADDYGLLNLVLAVVRELALLSAAADDGDSAVNAGQAKTAVGHALDLLSRFDDVTKHVSTAEGALAKVRSTADGLRAALLTQLQEATRALRPGTTEA